MERRERGFTLIELITVVVIIAILAALALPQYAKVMEKSRSAEAMEAIGHLRRAALAYYQASGNVTAASYASVLTNQTGITTGSSVASTTCSQPDRFFNYSITAAGGGLPNATFTATRCESAGKGPNAPTGAGYFVNLTADMSSNATVDAWAKHGIYE